MISCYAAQDVYDAEEQLRARGVPGGLMARAATALATRILPELRRRRGKASGSRVVLLVGSGANGGDALLAGVQLMRWGVGVLAVTSQPRVHQEAFETYRRAGGRALSIVPSGLAPHITLEEAVSHAVSCDAVVDGLLGIGARGPITGPGAALLTTLEVELGLVGPHPYRPGRPVVIAVDLPSGVGVDDGTIDGPVLPADLTVTFGAYKPATFLPPAALACGRVELVDIGVSAVLESAGVTPVASALTDSDIAELWPVPKRTAHKYTRGVLGVVAGSDTYPGAAVLTSAAAVRAGIGMVRYLGPAAAVERVMSQRPEVVPGGGRVGAWALGPGVAPGADDQIARIRQAFKWALSEKVPTVVDAGAFTELPEKCAPWLILTPHAGEMATLLADRGIPFERDQIEREPVRAARLAAELTGATVLLKGPATVVAAPDGAVYVQADGTPWLATAGSGDVLTGLLGAIVAGHGSAVAITPGMPARLAAVAALVHGRAAMLAAGDGPVPGASDGTIGAPIGALDVVEALPATIGSLLRMG